MERPREGNDRGKGSAIIRQLKRLYRNDSDVRVSLNCVCVSCLGGVSVCLFYSIPSYSYFSSLGLLLFFILAYTHKFSLNPAIGLQAAFLGFIAGSCISSIVFSSSIQSTIFFVYLFLLCFFHFSEFLLTAVTNRRALQADSFLLNHSWAYWIAAWSAWTEYWIEAYFFPSSKNVFCLFLGVLLCLTGEILRKGAMVEAGLAFTHRLALTKRVDHRLITTGIYSYMRHPGYVGWFIWSAGTQVLLANPVCFVLYVLVTWTFFNERIEDEERDLVRFFGSSYLEYRERVSSGIPFISGYPTERNRNPRTRPFI